MSLHAVAEVVLASNFYKSRYSSSQPIFKLLIFFGIFIKQEFLIDFFEESVRM